MENASKALLIAGGVLIAVMLISLGVYLFQNSSNLSASYFKKLEEDAINVFNSKFLTYEKDLYPQEMVGLINLVKEVNEKQILGIQIKVDGRVMDLNVNDVWKVNEMDVLHIPFKVENDVNVIVMEDLQTYKFDKINYDDKGRIKELVYRNI